MQTQAELVERGLAGEFMGSHEVVSAKDYDALEQDFQVANAKIGEVQTRMHELERALRLVLPLAKGYGHGVKSSFEARCTNAHCVATAEDILNATPAANMILAEPAP